MGFWSIEIGEWRLTRRINIFKWKKIVLEDLILTITNTSLHRKKEEDEAMGGGSSRVLFAQICIQYHSSHKNWFVSTTWYIAEALDLQSPSKRFVSLFEAILL